MTIAVLLASAGSLLAAEQRDKNQPDPLFDIDPTEAARNQHYDQPFRPQFHYTAMQGVVGDATGLINQQGDLHLFYMSDKWERRRNRHKCWGHATSQDGLHWVEQASILDPVLDNKPGSGSGIVDWNNTLGLATGAEKTLAVFYTDYGRGTCIAYSTDAGKTWTRHPRNPVLAGPGGARDPLVFWYAPAGQWRMIRFDGKTGFVFYGSSNLIEWKQLDVLEGFYECPDFFELPVEGGSGAKKWVLLDAKFAYQIGAYDGQHFTAETPLLKCEVGRISNIYASQSWKQTPQGSVPLMQLAFLHYPKESRLTWHCQMTFPCELHLRQLPEGLRLCRQPIQALDRLRSAQTSWNNLTITPGQNPLAELRGDLFDLRTEIELTPNATLTLTIRGQPIRYSTKTGLLELGATRVPLKLAGNRLRLHVLVDRSSIELFADQGQVSISKVIFFDPAQTAYSLTADSGELKLLSFQANRLKSIWDAPPIPPNHESTAAPPPRPRTVFQGVEQQDALFPPSTVQAQDKHPTGVIPDQRARFIVEPKIFIQHTLERSFIGPGLFQLENGDILMAAPWGRPPTNFEQLAARFPVPMLYRSRDGGRTWQEQGRMKMAWSLGGMVSDGGVNFLRLKDGRLAFLSHRHVKGLQGGGLPVLSFSSDDGATWTPARVVGAPEGVWYVMNDRLIQLRSGRLLVPVAHMPKGAGTYEGAKNLGLCFFSDDGGQTWGRSHVPAKLDDQRGMAEPCVAEVGEGRLLMLARTGSGFLYSAWSHDGGDTWSKPEPTTLVSACSSLTLKTLPDGRLIVFYDHAVPLKPGAFFPRTPLCYAVSGDGGQHWGPPVSVDDEGVEKKDRQNIYPSVCFTKEGMLVVWSTHGADPQGSFACPYEAHIGGGKRAILAYPEALPSAPATSPNVKASQPLHNWPPVLESSKPAEFTAVSKGT